MAAYSCVTASGIIICLSSVILSRTRLLGLRRIQPQGEHMFIQPKASVSGQKCAYRSIIALFNITNKAFS